MLTARELELRTVHPRSGQQHVEMSFQAPSPKMRNAPQREHRCGKHQLTQRLLLAYTVELHFEDLKRHECNGSVNSSDLAAHAVSTISLCIYILYIWYMF